MFFVFRMIAQIKERKAQIARFAFWTVPMTAMTVGWMGGLELGKSLFGRDSLSAWAVAATVPGGIFGVWRRCPYKSARSTAFFAAVGMIYQHSTNNNLHNFWFFPDQSNPNIPHLYKNPFMKDWSFWNIENLGTDKEWSHVSEVVQQADPGPSWKKWEDKE